VQSTVRRPAARFCFAICGRGLLAHSRASADSVWRARSCRLAEDTLLAACDALEGCVANLSLVADDMLLAACGALEDCVANLSLVADDRISQDTGN
jgi:hypothetical protein